MTTYNRGGALVVAIVALALSVRCVLAKPYVVGEGLCSPATWGQDLSCDYNTWAKLNDYAVGDSLVFKFTAGDSNVAEVTKDDYDGCPSGLTPANPLYVYSRPPVTITLSKPGTFYFASTVGSFICFSQHMAVIVNGSTTDAPAGPTSPSTPADPTSSSTSTGGGDNTPTTTTTSTASSTASDATPATSLKSSPSQRSSHSSIVGPVVGSVGSVLVIAKIVAVSYYLHRRGKQKVNMVNGQGPPKHEPAPYPVFNFNVNSHEDVNVHGFDDPQVPFGVPANHLNP